MIRLVAALLICVTLRAAAQDFSGTFVGEKFTLTLAADRAAANGYSGTIVMGDRRMPARGTFDPAGGFRGTFDAAAGQFAFTLERRDGQMILTTGGATHVLRPGAGPRPDFPDPAARAILPAVLKPGTRITYHAGDSVVQGVQQRLVENKDGDWIDHSTGKRYGTKDVRSSGGVGYTQITVVSAAPEFVAADVRNYLISDPQRNISASAGGAALVGSAAQLGDYWMHPARLAQLQEGRTPDGVTVSRQAYNLNGKTLDGIAIVKVSNTSYLSQIFDRETGLLLSMSSSYTGERVWGVQTGGKTAAPAAGAAAISHARLLDVRDTQLPWANEPAPQWLAKGQRLEFRGGYNGIPQAGQPLPPLAMSVTFDVGQVANNVAAVRLMSRQDIGPGLPPQESTMERCYGSAMPAGLWVPPRALAQLRPGQVVDEDRVTGFRTTFAGVQNNVATFVEQGPTETSRNMYDPQSGMLVAIHSLRQQAAGMQTQIQLQLAR